MSEILEIVIKNEKQHMIPWTDTHKTCKQIKYSAKN